MSSGTEWERNAIVGGCTKTPMERHLSATGKTAMSKVCGGTLSRLLARCPFRKKVKKYGVTPKLLCSTARRKGSKKTSGVMTVKSVGNDMNI